MKMKKMKKKKLEPGRRCVSADTLSEKRFAAAMVAEIAVALLNPQHPGGTSSDSEPSPHPAVSKLRHTGTGIIQARRAQTGLHA
jgi:hypothetical protein